MKTKMKLSLRNRGKLKQKFRFSIIAASAGFAGALAIAIFMIYGNFGVQKIAKALPGKDGAKIITVPNTIINEFTALTADVSVSGTLISVSGSGLNTNGRFSSVLSTGDLVMIIQMQGAAINTTDDSSSSWGEITSYNDCGNFEFAEVSDVPSATMIMLASGLNHSYTCSGKVQVIRVPRFSSLEITSSGSLTTQPWNGNFGGVCAIEVNGNTILNGTINVSGLGFRGGIAEQNSALPGNHGAFASINANDGAEKGEGIAGYQSVYDASGGRYGRGAPANGGGGGNSYNASGGGGANAGNVYDWNGMGNPDTSVNNWKICWNLESSGFASNISTGGGRGGYSSSMDSKDPLIHAPGSPLWGGDSRFNNGGYGGRPLDYSTEKFFLGGGGGAGDSDNGTGTSGVRGGGIVYLISNGTVSGTGSINANGHNGLTTMGPSGRDGTGGGGGGGSVMIYSTGIIANITINANGGKGGNQDLQNNSETEGSGGGGGGGYTGISNSSGVTLNVNGGIQGISNSITVSSFTPNGGTRGAAGMIGPQPSLPYSSGNVLSVMQSEYGTAPEAGTVKISPNPFSDTFTAQFNSDEKTECFVQLINSQGATVYSEKFLTVSGNNTFHFYAPAHFSSGNYLLRFSSGISPLGSAKVICKK